MMSGTNYFDFDGKKEWNLELVRALQSIEKYGNELIKENKVEIVS